MKQYLTTVFFVKSLRDSYPEITDEEIADELFKAKIYRATTTTEAMRQYMTQQAEDNYYKQEENNKVFSEQLEAQRHEIVETVEDINDIGASISPLR
jgi:ABC-type Zn2+ transport system substrate-binding protein/surface adhesin